MATTVTYKGNTLTTVNNQTRVLNTSGTYLEDDITLVDVSSGGGGDIYQDQDGYLVLSDEGGGGGGGASNIVTGTFKGTTTGAAMDVTLNYTGSGYPIAVMIFPEGGIQGNSTFNSTIQRYAIAEFAATKCYTSQTPDYTGINDNSYGNVLTLYKNSTSSANNYTRTSATKESTYNTGGASNTASRAARFKSKSTMSVYITSTSYGFMANIDYRYYVIYSS